LFIAQSCELFVIKGKKIVVEEQSYWIQKTPSGVVAIFIRELDENILTDSKLLIKDDGR
jgi:hypothetical protein